MNKPLILLLLITLAHSHTLPLTSQSTIKASSAIQIEPIFFEAAKNGDLIQLQECLSAGINPNTTNEENKTALMYAAEKNHPEAVKLLIASGADIEACHYRATALVYAVHNGNTACVKMLLNAGANVHICLRFNGEQGILHLVRNEDPEILRMLIQAGAPLNQTDDGGSTRLGWAASEGNSTFVTILLDAGANPNCANHSLFGSGPITPLMNAARKGFVDIIKALLSAKADINLKDKDGKTALDYAATEEIKILLQTT